MITTNTDHNKQTERDRGPRCSLVELLGQLARDSVSRVASPSKRPMNLRPQLVIHRMQLTARLHPPSLRLAKPLKQLALLVLFDAKAAAAKWMLSRMKGVFAVLFAIRSTWSNCRWSNAPRRPQNLSLASKYLASEPRSCFLNGSERIVSFGQVI